MSLKKQFLKFARLVDSATTILIFLDILKPKGAKASDGEYLNWLQLQRFELSPPRRNKWIEETPGMAKGKEVASMKKQQRRQPQDEALAKECVEKLIVNERCMQTRTEKYSVDQRWKGESLSHDKMMRRELRRAKKMVSRIDPQLLKPGPWASNVSFEEQHEIALNEIRGWTPQSRANEIMVFDDTIDDPCSKPVGIMLTLMDEPGTPPGRELTIQERFAGTICVDEEARVRFLRHWIDWMERQPTTVRLPNYLVYSIARDVDSKRQLARLIKFFEHIVEAGANGDTGLVPLATARFRQAQIFRKSSHRAKRSSEILSISLPLTNHRDFRRLSWTNRDGTVGRAESQLLRQALNGDCAAEKNKKYYKNLHDQTHHAFVDANLHLVEGVIIW